MKFYDKHIFFCTKQRPNGEACCANHDAAHMCSYMKEKLKELGHHGPGQFRVNLAGCMGRCEEGPVMVVYPEGVWYTYHTEEDINEIIQSHLLYGNKVERLLLG